MTPKASLGSRLTYNRPVATPKILLYYSFAPIPDPEAIRLWQRTLADSLGLRGRIIISGQGINGTLGGDVAELKKYVRRTKEYAPFKTIDFKWSHGTLAADGSSADFPRLTVKVRPEVVTFGAADELKVDEHGVIGGGARLTPQQLHRLVAQEDVVFFDGRNKVEAEIGRFKGAVVPDVASTRDFLAEIDSGKFDHLKDRPVVTYCTGGIRCEVLTPLMRNRGFTQVYQLDGGIAGYGEAFKDSGLWEGALYVFDNRKMITFSDQATVIGHCHRCDAPSSQVHDCRIVPCQGQLVLCTECATRQPATCTKHASAGAA